MTIYWAQLQKNVNQFFFRYRNLVVMHGDCYQRFFLQKYVKIWEWGWFLVIQFFLVLLDECYIFYLSFNECGRNYTEGNEFKDYV